MSASLVPTPSGLPLLMTPDAPQPCAACGRCAALLVPVQAGVRTLWVCLSCPEDAT